MSKYSPLTVFLSQLSPEEKELTLSFDRLESVLGCELPQTAKVDRPWWANTFRSNHAKSWINVGWKVHKVALVRQEVIFCRTDGKETSDPADTKTQGGYKLFKLFLYHLPNAQQQLALTFDEIETIIQKKLPNIALVDRPWWANTKSSPQGTSWVSSGWQIEQVFLQARIIVFRKHSDTPLISIPRYVRSLLESRTHYGRPGNHTLVKWIKFCRKLGWYFEGSVLYEKSGLSLESLDEIETDEVEEHYAVCKRELNRYRK
jgi:hypothetical protein